MFFCKKCSNFSPVGKCQFCGAKKLREAQESDPVYLTTKTFVYAGMLQEVLEQNNIPFMRKEKNGGILKFMGFGLGIEEFNFFVPLGAYEKAKELLAELFETSEFTNSEEPDNFK